jgi:hypothetical protein
MRARKAMLFLSHSYSTHIHVSELFGIQTFVKKKRPGFIIQNSCLITKERLSFWSQAAKYNATIPNAGGFSIISETLSIDLMALLFQAKKFVSENEVKYRYQCKKLDYLCSINGEQVGVSVSRAAMYEELTDEHGNYTPRIAYRQLRKKLDGLVVARAGITKAHAYDRSILHFFCETEHIARLLIASFPQACASKNVKDEVSLLITVCAHPALYSDDLTLIL